MNLRMTHKDRLTRFEGEALLYAAHHGKHTLTPAMMTAYCRAQDKLCRAVLDARSREFAAKISRSGRARRLRGPELPMEMP